MADLIDLNLASRKVLHKHIEANSIRDRLNANPRSFLNWLFSGRAIYSGARRGSATQQARPAKACPLRSPAKMSGAGTITRRVKAAAT